MGRVYHITAGRRDHRNMGGHTESVLKKQKVSRKWGWTIKLQGTHCF